MTTEIIKSYGQVRWIRRDDERVLQQHVGGYRWSDDDSKEEHFVEWRDVPEVEGDG